MPASAIFCTILLAILGIPYLPRLIEHHQVARTNRQITRINSLIDRAVQGRGDPAAAVKLQQLDPQLVTNLLLSYKERQLNDDAHIVAYNRVAELQKLVARSTGPINLRSL